MNPSLQCNDKNEENTVGLWLLCIIFEKNICFKALTGVEYFLMNNE